MAPDLVEDVALGDEEAQVRIDSATDVNLMDEQRPLLLVGCPPCRPFSTLFESSASRMRPEARKATVREGVVHLSFCIKSYDTIGDPPPPIHL